MLNFYAGAHPDEQVLWEGAGGEALLPQHPGPGHGSGVAFQKQFSNRFKKMTIQPAVSKTRSKVIGQNYAIF
jgi:hypothetical protein